MSGQHYPHTAAYRMLPKNHDTQVWFQSLGYVWQLYFYWTWFKCNDAGILDINLLDFSRATGIPLPVHDGFENYVKCMNQDGVERVVLINNGKTILYPYVLWYMKGGVLNLAVEHDAWCYEQWLLAEIPQEYLESRFNIVNESDFDMETFMKNVDLNIREAVRVTPKWEELFPRSFISHIKMPDGYIMHKQVNEFFDQLRNTYPNSPKKGSTAACYVTYYKWITTYPHDIQAALKWIDKQRPKDYKYAPLQEFLSMRMYLNED